MKPVHYTLCLTLTSAGLAFADHHGGDHENLSKKLDDLLAGISQPDEVQRYEPRMAVRDMTSAASLPGAAHRGDYVKLLLDRLANGETSQAAKAWILRQLENVGREESVPALQKLMGSPFHQLRELARRALEQNPSDAAVTALRELAKSERDRNLQRALVHSLGMRGDDKAVGLMGELLGTSDKALRTTAIEALGRIASAEAIAHLVKLQSGDKDKLAVANALLDAAGENADHAQSILQTLRRSDQPAHIQAAAFRSIVAADSGKADDKILLALQSKEAQVRQAAINACRGLKGTSILPNVLATKLPDLNAVEAQMALAVLADSGDSTVAPQLSGLLGDDKLDGELRAGIVGVLGRLGGSDAASSMLEAAALSNDGDYQEAARTALAQMPGKVVDASLIAATRVGDIQVRSEAIRSLGARGHSASIPLLFSHIDAGPRAIREASLTALGDLATGKEIPRLVSYVSSDDKLAIKAVMLACRRATEPDNAAESIIAAMGPMDTKGKELLLPCLGILGGERALSEVQGLLKVDSLKQAAMKTLTGWSGPEAGPALLKLASSEGVSGTDQTLILRGLGRLLESRDNGIEAGDRLALALKGISTAKRPEEKRLFLPVLGSLGSKEAIDALVGMFGDKEIGEEAGLATLSALRRMRGRQFAKEKQQILKSIIRSEFSKDTIERAQSMLDRL